MLRLLVFQIDIGALNSLEILTRPSGTDTFANWNGPSKPERSGDFALRQLSAKETTGLERLNLMETQSGRSWQRLPTQEIRPPFRALNARRPLFVTLAAILVCFGLFSHAAAAAHRVALGAFTSDENTWESLQTVERIAPALQAALGHVPEVEWVERQQLGAILQEQALAGFGSSVRAARLARADWMITGRFVTVPQGGRELVLEAIDLAHADVLAEQRVALTVGAMRETMQQIPAIATGVRALLGAAAQRERAVAGWPTVAVLFYPNLAGFPQEFEAALQDPQLAGGRLRLLRLPRASLAAEEAALVLAGFTEDGPGAWRSIADTYVWGTLKKLAGGSIGGETITDARTPEITLEAWDGKRTPVRFTEESKPVGRANFPQAMTERARRLAGRVAELALHPRAGESEEAQRVQVARGLVQAAEELEKSKAYNADSFANVEGQRHYLNLVQTLEAACFFDPQNASALEWLLRVRWSHRAELSVKSAGRFQVDRCEAWGRYVERFGYKSQGPSRRVGRPDDTHEGPIAQEFLKSAIALVRGTDYPADMPPQEAAERSDRRAREVARRMILVAGEDDARPLAGLSTVFETGPTSLFIRDPKYRVHVLETVWPKLSAATREKLAVPGAYLFREVIARTYVEAGRPGGEARFFSMTPRPDAPPPPAPAASAKPPSSNSTLWAAYAGKSGYVPPFDYFLYQPFSLPVPSLPAAERMEGLGSLKVRQVRQMVALEGRLWVIGEVPDDTPVQGPNLRLQEELRPAGNPIKRLFACDLAGGAAHRVEAARLLEPSGLFVHEGRLWISLAKGGAAVLDPKEEKVRSFGPDDGVTADAAYRFATADGKLFATEGLRLFHFDPVTQRWQNSSGSAKPLPFIPAGFPGAGLRGFAGVGPWLLRTAGIVSIQDVRVGGWKSYRDLVSQGAPLRVNGSGAVVSADATGFWIAAAASVCRLDPASGRLTHELPAANPYAFRQGIDIADAVAALARQRAALPPEAAHLAPWQAPSGPAGIVAGVLADGDFLWLVSRVTSARQPGRLQLWHPPSGRWIGEYALDYLPMVVADENYLWLCYNDDGRPAQLHRIEKQRLYSLAGQDPPSEEAARDAYEKLSIRDRAFCSFTRGRYAEAAALFAQVSPDEIRHLRVEPGPEALFMQALCYDAQGLAQPARQRACLEQLLKSTRNASSSARRNGYLVPSRREKAHGLCAE